MSVHLFELSEVIFNDITIALNMATLKQVQRDVKLLEKRTNMDSELWRLGEV